MSESPLAGASTFDQELYDHVSSHVHGEVESLQAYEQLAATTESKAFAFLAALVLEDERRHHHMLADLAQTIQISAELSQEQGPIPYLDLHTDREILAATERLLAVEKDDEKKLKRLAKEMKDFKDTTLWELLLEIMRADNAKHRMILTFVREHAKRNL